MDIRAYTTRENRQELRTYLRNRRLVGSLHQTITLLTLNDLEEALRLLEGIHQPSPEWASEIESFLSLRTPPPTPDASLALPGLLEGH